MQRFGVFGRRIESAPITLRGRFAITGAMVFQGTLLPAIGISLTPWSPQKEVLLGVLITLLIEIGMLTPPVGMNLYVLTGMTNGQVRLGQAAVAALPYWLALLVLIVLIVAFPGIVTWLPSLVSL